MFWWKWRNDCLTPRFDSRNLRAPAIETWYYIPEQQLRLFGLVSAAIGVALVWMVRG
ncbi:DUF2065 family protein [Pararhizobium polonicum]|uniref:DUF2065 family protein n=1 Tax=Pararhizobium polonicum TaxID=1612624 RepID=UPI003CC8A084